MAIQKYKVEVTRVDEYEIEIDDSVYTDEFIEEWSESFYSTDEDNRQENFIKHLAEAITRKETAEGLEGFGYVKQRLIKMPEGQFLRQPKYGLNKVSEEEYAPGLMVTINSYDDDYQTEIFKQ